MVRSRSLAAAAVYARSVALSERAWPQGSAVRRIEAPLPALGCCAAVQGALPLAGERPAPALHDSDVWNVQGATHLFERYVLPVLSQYDLQTSAPTRSPRAADVAPALDKASAFLRTLEAEKRS